ncbi:MAG: tyrosine-type recombinase/integrase [Clostridiales bacterium]|jgi:integrase|nr:tyrosine-type recombinase/integrase [Clostridiales bacterium]
MAATQPIRDKQQVKQLVNYYMRRGQYRNHVLIVMSVYTALRISDLLRLRWSEVYNFEKKQVRSSITITEKKTGKSKTIALNKNVKRALSKYMAKKQNILQHEFIIQNPRTGKAISRIQAYRIIRAAGDALGIGHFSCHSLRKTFGYHAWKTGVSPAVIMEIYDHSSFSVTRRYLGVTQDDKDEVYLNICF